MVIIKDHPYYQFPSGAPAGPVLNVEISDSPFGKREQVLAMIDPSADITCVSAEKIRDLEAKLGYPLMIQSIKVIDSSGQSFPIQTYAMCVILEGRFSYIPDNGVLQRQDDVFGEEDMLIGRDILANLNVLLDGPNQTFSIEDPVWSEKNGQRKSWRIRR